MSTRVDKRTSAGKKTNMGERDYTAAKAAYEAFYAALGSKYVPGFSQMSTEVQDAWFNSASAAVTANRAHVNKGDSFK